jgi:hypothetical protein
MGTREYHRDWMRDHRARSKRERGLPNRDLRRRYDPAPKPPASLRKADYKAYMRQYMAWYRWFMKANGIPSSDGAKQ